MSKLPFCLVEHQSRITPFDRDLISKSAKAYETRGMNPKDAEIQSVKDRLGDALLAKSKLNQEILAAYDAQYGKPVVELTGQTNAQAAAEYAKNQEPIKKDEPAGPVAKGDQADLLNTQGSLFNSNRDAAPKSSDITNQIENAKRRLREANNAADKYRGYTDDKLGEFAEKAKAARQNVIDIEREIRVLRQRVFDQESDAAPNKSNTVADRLDQIYETLSGLQTPFRMNSPEWSAMRTIKSTAEELRKEATPISVSAVLNMAAQRLTKNHPDIAQKVSAIASEIDGAVRIESGADLKATLEAGKVALLSDGVKVKVEQDSTGWNYKSNDPDAPGIWAEGSRSVGPVGQAMMRTKEYAVDRAMVKFAYAYMNEQENLARRLEGTLNQGLHPSGRPLTHSEAQKLKDQISAANIASKVEMPVSSPTIESKASVGESNGRSIQQAQLPGFASSETEGDAAAGNRDSKPLDAGLAGTGEWSDRERGVSGRAQKSGSAGTGSVEQTGNDAPVSQRNNSGVRAGSEPAIPNGDGITQDDFSIDAEDIGKGGLAKKYRDNITAIKIIKAMEAEDRLATPEERKLIARYAGWGAMKGAFDPENKQWSKQYEELKALLTDDEFKAARKSTLNAHYTSPIAVGAMYDAMKRIGFTGGRVLEPSVGVGNFFGLMPTALRNASNLHGVELDSLTSRLVAALYPKAKIAKATGFQDYDVPAEFFDAVIGNPPFGNEPIVDMDRSPYSGFSIHNYFLAKSIDKLRPGGIMQVVVSHSFLDSQDERARKWISERASLIGAVRLPNTAFKENAGTEVVTDILIFQKKSESQAANGLNSDIGQWIRSVDQKNTNPKTGDVVTHSVSEFFVNNPKFILGTPSAAGKQYAPNQYTVEATGDIKPMLEDWVKTLPENIFTPIDRRGDKNIVDMEVPDGIKPGSFYVAKDGRVMQRGNDVMGNRTASEWTGKNATAGERMKGMIQLRDLLRAQMRLERSLDSTEKQIEDNRAKMNVAYDAFLAKYGHLNSQTNRSVFLDDTESQLVQALEFDFDKGVSKAIADREGIDVRPASAKKADIFNQRVAFPPSDFMKVTSAKDALLASLNYRGKVDLQYMADVYSKTPDEIIDELGDVVFDDPQDGIVTADAYLSGDVKTKLVEAKAAALADPRMQRNVDALEKVIPEDKKPSEISVSIGASFVPDDVYDQFIRHITGSGAGLSYIKATGQWLISYTGTPDVTLNTATFGTKDLSARELFGLTMLGKGAVVKKIYKNADGSTTTVLLEKETEAAREKQNAIQAEWQKWLWSDAARADRMVSIYNDKMNRIVERPYDGRHLSFPGMNPAITLLEHQSNGVWRGLQSLQVLYDQCVGAGKTYEMATLAMEMRRLGIARKPLFVVPNHLTLQWRSDFARLYPGSNVLAATPEDFSKENRGRMFSRIITGDWDAVIVGHSSLKKIGLPEETEKAVLQEQIDEVSEAIEATKRERGDRNIIRDMEGIRSRLEAKMKDKLASIGKRDKVVTFDELGIDAMFIDEMHEFKNLQYNSTMDRNPGMGNPAGSSKAFDMFVKVRWLFDTFGEKTPFITATGTPVSNSLVEMFNMQRYMQYPTLKKEGLHVFDAWAKQFGKVENVYEVAPSGSGFRQSTRFAKFANLPALMSLYNSFADTITLDDLKTQEEALGKRFPVPKMVGGKPQIVVAKRSPMVADLMGVPRAQVDDAGNVMFGADLSQPIVIEPTKDGKFLAKVGEANFGTFDTEQDARLRIVEKATAPVVSVDPKSILGRFANLKQLTKETKGKVNALSLTGEANKAGLDYRLINPAAPDFAGSKINMAVDNMVRIYGEWKKDKGAQLVFCDMSIPLSARSSYSSKERKLYVRGEDGQVEMKRGTMHATEGFEMLPFFIVSRGQKEAKRFDVYDAASGGKVMSNYLTKADAKTAIDGIITNFDKRQKWIEFSEKEKEISQGEIDEFNNDNDVEAEDLAQFFTREDIAGMSGSAKFSVYDDIKAKLIANGIPEREIAFIHDFSTPTAKDKLFKAVNSGDVRFLLGSTPKMGAGTNVQKRLVALHHIDAPWRPSDLEQREGRIIRRGNELYERDPDGFEVFIGRYATEQTYDTRRWQILEHKSRGIEQLRNFDGTTNEIEDIDGEASNAADMKAAASGDPLILEETKLRNEVKRLERLQDSHADERLAMERKAASLMNYVGNSGPEELAMIRGLIAEAAKNPADKKKFAKMRISGLEFSDPEKAATELGAVVAGLRLGTQQPFNVVFRGQVFSFSKPYGENIMAKSDIGTTGTWGASEAFSPSGFIQRMINHVDRLPAIEADILSRIEKSKADAANLRERAKLPFGQAADLEKTRADHTNVRRALMAKGPAVPEEQKAMVAEGVERQKMRLEALGYGDAVKEAFSAKFARAVSGSKIAMDDLRVVANKFRDEFPGISVVVVEDEKQAPKSLRDEIKAAGATGDVAGAFHDGQIFLIQSGIRDIEHAQHTVTHEGVHGGLSRIGIPDEVLVDVWRSNVKLQLAAKRIKDKYKYSQVRSIEEAMADMGQAAKGMKGWGKIVGWFRAKLRRIGFDMAWSDNDIDYLLLRALGSLKRTASTSFYRKGTAFSGNSSPRTPFVAQANDGYLPALNKAIDAFQSGDRRKIQEAGNAPIPISRTPVVLRQIIESDGSKPFKRSEFVVGQGSTLYLKAADIHAKSNHGDTVSNDLLRELPQLLADPVAVFKSSSEGEDPNSFKILLDASSDNGNPVVVAIKPNQAIKSLGGGVAHWQATIYPTSWGNVASWNEGGYLRYYNEKSQRARVVGNNPRESGSEMERTRTGFDPSLGERASKVKVITKGEVENMPRSALSRAGQQAEQTVAEKAKSAERKATEFLRKKGSKETLVDSVMRTATQAVGVTKATAFAGDKVRQLLDALVPETAKAGMVSDYGIPQAVIDRRDVMFAHQRKKLGEVSGVIERLSMLTRAESRVAYEWMNNRNADHLLDALPEESRAVLREVKSLVDTMSKEAVRLGQLSSDSYERHAMAYLNRSYMKWESESTPGEKRSRAKAKTILGESYKGRGMTDEAPMARIKNGSPEWWNRKTANGKADKQLKGEKFIRLERRAANGFGSGVLEGMGEGQLGKLLEVNYWPAGLPMPAKYGAWHEAGVWEARDTKGDKLLMWRDFTKAERETMGEIDEVRYSIAKTMHQMIHNIEVGNYLEWLSSQHGLTEAQLPRGASIKEASGNLAIAYSKDDWVQVPDTAIAGTGGVKRYGKLAGAYLPGPIWNDIRQVVGTKFNPFGDQYAAVLKMWKISKTALSPAVHLNNVMANMVMADWHDVRALDVAEALSVVINGNKPENKIIIDMFENAGGSQGMYILSEIQREQLAPLMDELQKEIANADERVGMMGVGAAIQAVMKGRFTDAYDALAGSKGTKVAADIAEKMIEVYQAEDTVFRLAAYIKARRNGSSDIEAGRAARESFLDYNINAPWVNYARQTALPFVSFTYRAVPMMLKTIEKKPWKILKLAMFGAALNALGYALSGGDEDKERKYLPEEKAGRMWGTAVPKLIRMPWNDKNGSPVFLDIRRFVPLGDFFDVGQTHSAIPVLPSMIAGGPIAVLAELLFNKSQFTGKAIVKDTDTTAEQTAAVLDHLFKSFAPNIIGVPGTYATSGAIDAAKGRTDVFGREQSVPMALASGFGVKAGAYPTDVLQRNAQMDLNRKVGEIKGGIRSLARERARGGLSDAEFADKSEAQRQKILNEVGKYQSR